MKPLNNPKRGYRQPHGSSVSGTSPMAGHAQIGRNRRTGLRLVWAVLGFHGLALFGSYLVLDGAVHAPPVVDVTVSAAPVAVAPLRDAVGSADAGEWPAWLAETRRRDAAAPWQVDAHGHVRFHDEAAR